MGSSIDFAIMLTATDAASSVIRNLGNAFGPVGGALATIGLAAASAAIGLGVTAVQASGDFQQAMLSNVAHAGLAKTQIDAVSQSVLQMATAVGRDPTQLAEALYPILSAFSGISNQSAKSSIALQTLKDSFQAVAGTTVDGTAVANAAVGTFNALGLSTNNVATNTIRMNNLFDIMDKTVQLGNMQWDAYKNVISKLAVSIQGTGISFNEASSALATMTNEGFSAQKAQTYLSNTFTTLAIKTDALAAHAKKLGITFDEQKYSSMSLADKITYLNQVTDGNKQKLLALMGNNATALKTFNALSTGIDAYKSNLDSLNHAQGALAQSFAVASQGFNFQMSQVRAAGQVLLITIGNALLPVVSQFTAKIVPLISQFTAWITKSGVLQQVAGGLASTLSVLPGIISGIVTIFETILSIGASVVSFFQQNQWAVDALGVAVGALGGILALFAAASVARTILSLLSFMSSMAATAASSVTTAVTVTSTFPEMAGIITSSMMASAGAVLATIGPFLLIGAVIAAVVIGVVLAVQHWGQISAWLQSAWSNVLSWLTGALHNMEGPVNAVVTWFNQWKTPILVVGGIITAFFLPALIKVGVQSAIAGAQMASKFIASMWQTGTAATVNGAKTSSAFVGSMIKAGTEAVVNGAKVTISFIGSMIKAGVQAVISAAKVTASFVMSMIKAGLEGWAAAGKLGIFIGQMVLTGVKAAWAGIQIAAGFVSKLVMMGVQAVIAGAKFVASLIPAIISFVTTSVTAAATAIPPMIAGFIAWTIGAWNAAAATIAATWPVLLIIVAILALVAIIILLVTHWSQVVAFLHGAWQAFSSWFMSALHAVGAFFTSIWNSIVSFIVGVWNHIVDFVKAHALLLLAVITGPIGAIVILIITHWNQIMAFLAAAWAWVVSTATTLWQDVVTVFTNAWSGLHTAITGLWNKVVSIVSTWPGQMLSFGQKIIQFLINGITGMIGSVGNAVGQVWNKISSFFPHSPPKEGPGVDLPNWGPRTMKMFADGMTASIPLLEASMHMVMKPVAGAMGSPSSIRPSGVASSSVGGNSGGVTVIIQSISVNDFGPNMPQTVINQLTSQISQKLAQNMRGQRGSIIIGNG